MCINRVVFEPIIPSQKWIVIQIVSLEIYLKTSARTQQESKPTLELQAPQTNLPQAGPSNMTFRLPNVRILCGHCTKLFILVPFIVNEAAQIGQPVCSSNLYSKRFGFRLSSCPRPTSTKQDGNKVNFLFSVRHVRGSSTLHVYVKSQCNLGLGENPFIRMV